MTYLYLCLSEGEVDWKHVVSEHFGKYTDSSFHFFVKRLVVEFVELQTSDKFEFRDFVHVRLRGILSQSRVEWDQERDNECTLTLLHKHHPLRSFVVNVLSVICASSAASLGCCTSSKVIEVEIVQTLTDIREVEHSLAFLKHF